MTIASAIAALNPNLWYKLDEPAGSTATNSGSLANNGTYSGSRDQGFPGPEVGTFATRMYAGATVTSIAMDITSFRDLTLGLWVNLNPTGPIQTVAPLWGIGDPGNRLTRGPLLYESHGAVTTTPNFVATWRNGSTFTTGTPVSASGWHWVVVTYSLSGNIVRFYIDSTTGGSGVPGSITACALTDPAILGCAEPIVVAHACVWLRTLLPTEILSVASQMSPWPYGLPINGEPAGGGGDGGLTPPQEEKIDDILGYVDDIPGMVDALNFISSIVNILNGKMDALADAVAAVQGTLNTNIGPAIEGVHEKLDTMRDQITNLGNALSAQIGAGFSALGSMVQQTIDGITASISAIAGNIPLTIGQLLSRPAREATQENPLVLETCEPIDLDVSYNALYGVTLRILSYPPDIVWRTPDHAWAYNDLAVLTFEIGGVISERHGIHTLTHTVTPLPDSLPFGAGVVTAWLQPTGYHIKVDWLPGVCGELVGLIWPHG